MTNVNLSDFITIGGGLEWISVANTYTTSSGEAIIADTGAGAFTITLPATPVEGDYIVIVDGSDWSTANLTVARNGSTIDGLAENLIVDIGNIKIEFLYDGTTWKVYTNIGQVGVDETISLLGRTITGTVDQIAVTNGNGASGNPVISAVVASTAEAIAGTNNTKLMTPLRAAQARVDPENRIINGAFDFWQRGASFSAAQYGADRWVNITSGSGTVTQSRQAFTVGDILGTNNPTYFLRQTVSGQSGVGAYAFTIQRIEGVRSYAGQTITVLGWARRSSGSGNMTVEAEQSFGNGGSPSTFVAAISPTTVNLTGSFAPFAVVMTIPSIIGKTLGTNGNDYTGICFWASAGSDYNARSNSLGIQTIGVDLWGVHIKVGTHTTDAVNLYKQPELGPELARCQRYYEIGTGLLNAYYTSSSFGGGTARVDWKCTKRIAPTVVLTSGAGVGAATVSSSLAFTDRMQVWWSGASNAGDYKEFTYKADAEL